MNNDMVQMIVHAALLLVCSSVPAVAFLAPPNNSQCRAATSKHSQSVNHGTGDYYFEQQPKGTSFISQFSKRDLEERRLPHNMGRPFPPPSKQQVPLMQRNVVQRQPPAPAPMPPPYRNTVDDIQAFNDKISTNLKAMTGLLGDVKEALYSQTSDIRSLNQKYEEMEKRLERAEIFNTAISQDIYEMKSEQKSVASETKFSEPRYGPINEERRSSQKPREPYTIYDFQESGRKDSINEKLDEIKQQMNQLDLAVKVGEVTLNSHMEDINRRFDSLTSTESDTTMNYNQQFNQPQPRTGNVNQQFNQPQPHSQPQTNNSNQQYQQPQPPPYEPTPFPGNFQDVPPPISSFGSPRMGNFRYEEPRPGVSYEIPSRQMMRSQSSANQNTQRRNKSFISAISERELSQRRELFEPMPPMRPYFDSSPMDYYGGDYDDYYPDEPILDEGGYFEEDFYGY